MGGDQLRAQAPVGHQLQHGGHQRARVGDADVEGGAADVDLQEGQAGTAVQAAGARADAVGGGVGEGGGERVGADVRHQWGGGAPAQLAGAQRVQAEPLGVRADVGARVHEGDVAGAERTRDQAGVERAAGAEQRPPGEAGEDQHLGVGVGVQQCGEVGPDMAVGVADVVGDARGRRGVDAIRQGNEHRLGVGNGELIGEGAAEVPGGEAHAVGGERRHGQAAAGAPRAAGDAGAAVDLEGDDHAIARSHGGDALADGDHLGDAFVPEVQRQGELGGAQHERAVDVAGGGGDRVHHRPVGTRRARGRRLAPAQPRAGRGGEDAHPRPRRAPALGDAVADGGGQPPQALGAVAFEQQRHRGGGGGREEAGVVAQRPARALGADAGRGAAGRWEAAAGSSRSRCARRAGSRLA